MTVVKASLIPLAYVVELPKEVPNGSGSIGPVKLATKQTFFALYTRGINPHRYADLWCDNPL
jgi:hypothetical protein